MLEVITQVVGTNFRLNILNSALVILKKLARIRFFRVNFDTKSGKMIWILPARSFRKQAATFLKLNKNVVVFIFLSIAHIEPVKKFFGIGYRTHNPVSIAQSAANTRLACYAIATTLTGVINDTVSNFRFTWGFRHRFANSSGNGRKLVIVPGQPRLLESLKVNMSR